MAWFAARAVFFAVRIRDHVFPDEDTWFGMVRLFSRSWLPPHDSPASYAYGLVTHVPNLYFIVMGKLLALNPRPEWDLVYLRLLNVMLGLATLWWAWKLIRLLASSPAARLLFLVMLGHTMMLTFMAGAVNHDNLSTLMAVMALYYFVRFRQARQRRDLLALALCLGAGCLAKIVFLPFAAILLVVLAAGEASAWGRPLTGQGWRSPGNLLLAALALLLTLWNFGLYGGNYRAYGWFIPNMAQVLPVEACLKYRLFARNYVVRELKNGHLTYIEAQRLALGIRDPGDRAFALKMLDRAMRHRLAGKKKAPRLGRLAYALEWGQFMAARLYGVAAHLALYKTDRELTVYYLILLAGLVFFLGRWVVPGVRARPPTMAGVFFLIFAAYALVLMLRVNYAGYLASGFVGAALSGRYLFVVLAPLYAWLAMSLFEKTPPWWQWLAGLPLAGWFVYGDFPWFITHAGRAWFW